MPAAMLLGRMVISLSTCPQCVCAAAVPVADSLCCAHPSVTVQLCHRVGGRAGGGCQRSGPHRCAAAGPRWRPYWGSADTTARSAAVGLARTQRGTRGLEWPLCARPGAMLAVTGISGVVRAPPPAPPTAVVESMKRNIAFNGGAAAQKVKPSVGDARLVCLQVPLPATWAAGHGGWPCEVAGAGAHGLPQISMLACAPVRPSLSEASSCPPLARRVSPLWPRCPCRTPSLLMPWTLTLMARPASCWTRLCRCACWAGSVGGGWG